VLAPENGLREPPAAQVLPLRAVRLPLPSPLTLQPSPKGAWSCFQQYIDPFMHPSRRINSSFLHVAAKAPAQSSLVPLLGAVLVQVLALAGKALPERLLRKCVWGFACVHASLSVPQQAKVDFLLKNPPSPSISALQAVMRRKGAT